MSERYWDLEDALSEAGWSAEAEVPRLNVPQLQRAVIRMTEVAQRLAQEVRRLARDLSYAEARAGRSAAPGARVRGAPLIEGRSEGGPRHYLSDRPVNAGAPICLLMQSGWVHGRYEWGFQPGTPGRFYFAVPGVYDSVSIAIPETARLAWPDELA